MKHLVTNGCSFTKGKSWSHYLADSLDLDSYHCLAEGGAGNFYIADSTQDFLGHADLDPQHTMVIIMWSGVNRKDIKVSGSWFYHIQDQYATGRPSPVPDQEVYYVFSGGLGNQWHHNTLMMGAFDTQYKLSDPRCLCHDTVMNIQNLENYLRLHGYQFRFMSYVNYWRPDTESADMGGDYSIPFFFGDSHLYQHLDWDHWIFSNADRDGLGEFARDRGQLDSTAHPTHDAHRAWALEFVRPHLAQDSCVMQPAQRS
jgi:hypothetical protein